MNTIHLIYSVSTYDKIHTQAGTRIENVIFVLQLTVFKQKLCSVYAKTVNASLKPETQNVLLDVKRNSSSEVPVHRTAICNSICMQGCTHLEFILNAEVVEVEVWLGEEALVQVRGGGGCGERRNRKPRARSTEVWR